MWRRSYRISPQSNMRWRLKNTVGVMRKTATSTMTISRSSRTNSNTGPRKKKQKGGGSGHKAPENLPLCGEGLANLEQNQKPRETHEGGGDGVQLLRRQMEHQNEAHSHEDHNQVGQSAGEGLAQNSGHNRPLIRSRFPSRARKKEGAPMVRPLIMLRCRGMMG